MNKALITNYLKTSAILKNIYTFIGSFLIRFIGLFIRQDDKMILFNSFGGKKYDDSPKALYECIKKDILEMKSHFQCCNSSRLISIELALKTGFNPNFFCFS